MFKKWRYDFFIIWGNGMPYLDQIIKMIEENSNFEILMIYRYRPISIRSFIKHVYSCDYIPSEHLRKKTKYLSKVSKNVVFVFVKNINPQEQYYGENYFRNIESTSVKEFKEQVRNLYNPRENGVRTEQHVIHGSDNEGQTRYILQYLGFKDDINIFNENQYIISYPYHIGRYNKYSIKLVNSDLFYARIIKNGEGKIVRINETPHYQAAIGNIKEYVQYIEAYRGTFLCDYYSKGKYIKLINNFKYLEDVNGRYIIVKKYEDGYLIMDGLHRASILIAQGAEGLVVAEVEGEVEKNARFI